MPVRPSRMLESASNPFQTRAVDSMLPALRLLLAGVLTLSGITKLLDRAGSRKALSDFGVPDALVAPLGTALPVVELAVAVALLPASTAIYGAVAAVVLLGGFTIGIAVNLWQGSRAACHCFGQLSTEPIGWPVLARNGLLLAAGLVVVVAGWPDGGAGVGSWFAVLPPVVQAAVVVVVLACAGAATRGLVKARAAAQAPLVMPDLAAAALPAGTRAPAFSLPSIDDGIVSLDDLLAPGKRVVLVFIDPECGSCSKVFPDVQQWQRQRDDLTVAVISRGAVRENRAKLGSHTIARVLLQQEREVATAYGALGTPCALVINTDGTLATTPAMGDGAVRGVVERLERGVESRLPSAGDPAPPFTVPDLEGRDVSLDAYRGAPLLLLFWNPGCPYCQQLLGLMRLWEARPVGVRPALLIVSGGEKADNEAQGFRSTIVLDQRYQVAEQYGVGGTPSAVLIDAAGRLASAVAAGGAHILALIGQPDPAALDATTPAPTGEIHETMRTLPPGTRPQRQDCVQDELLVDGSMVLYNGCRKEVLTLNPTAALVWDLCDGEHSVEAIVAELREIFPEAATAESDVRVMLDSFLVSGMLVVPGAPAAAPVAG